VTVMATRGTGGDGSPPWSIPPAAGGSSSIARRCVGSSMTIKGGPLHPPGVRMAAALGEVQESIQR